MYKGIRAGPKITESSDAYLVWWGNFLVLSLVYMNADQNKMTNRISTNKMRAMA